MLNLLKEAERTRRPSFIHAQYPNFATCDLDKKIDKVISGQRIIKGKLSFYKKNSKSQLPSQLCDYLGTKFINGDDDELPAHLKLNFDNVGLTAVEQMTLQCEPPYCRLWWVLQQQCFVIAEAILPSIYVDYEFSQDFEMIHPQVAVIKGAIELGQYRALEILCKNPSKKYYEEVFRRLIDKKKWKRVGKWLDKIEIRYSHSSTADSCFYSKMLYEIFRCSVDRPDLMGGWIERGLLNSSEWLENFAENYDTVLMTVSDEAKYQPIARHMIAAYGNPQGLKESSYSEIELSLHQQWIAECFSMPCSSGFSHALISP